MTIAEDTPAPEPTLSAASRPPFRLPLWSLTGIGGIVLGAGLVFGILAQVGAPAMLMNPFDRPMSAEDLPALYAGFRCPCCDQNIGECTCQQAADRRDLIQERVTLRDTRREIYEMMLLRDGARAFFDPAAAAEAQLSLTRKLPGARPELTIEPEAVDLGTIRMADGPASARYTVRNDGQAPLTITALATSCACTTAVLETSKGTGPTFGMHENPTDWSLTLALGEEAILIVTFDPNYHGPDAVGDFLREATITSNDPLQPAAKVQMSMTVVK